MTNLTPMCIKCQSTKFTAISCNDVNLAPRPIVFICCSICGATVGCFEDPKFQNK